MQAVFAGALFEGVGNDGIHETRPAVMAEGGVVIQGDLGVQGAQLLGGFVIRVAILASGLISTSVASLSLKQRHILSRICAA